MAKTLSTTSVAPACVRDLRDRCDVDHVERRIGRRFQEEGLGVRPHGGAPLVEIGAVDQRRRHAVAGQVVLDDVAAGAEQRLGRDHVIAGLELADQRQRDRGHAGCGCARGFGTLERRHARLEHGDGRIGKARILKARVLVLEPALGLERSCRRRSPGSGTAPRKSRRIASAGCRNGPDGFRGGSDRRGDHGRTRTCCLLLAKQRPSKTKPGREGLNPRAGLTRPRPFSKLFYVAASRPAQMTTG